jgi:hypothetical protein
MNNQSNPHKFICKKDTVRNNLCFQTHKEFVISLRLYMADAVGSSTVLLGLEQEGETV